MNGNYHKGVGTVNKEEVTLALASQESTQRASSNIQSQYVAIQLMIDDKYKTANSEEIQELMRKEKKKHEDFLQSLGAKDTLTVMLATQMAAIHDLQQYHFLCSKKTTSPQQMQYHTNTVAKLTNAFIQQASLMQKLQGRGQQKVVVEHVHVNEGGQAIVGNVEGVSSERKN